MQTAGPGAETVAKSADYRSCRGRSGAAGLGVAAVGPVLQQERAAGAALPAYTETTIALVEL